MKFRCCEILFPSREFVDVSKIQIEISTKFRVKKNEIRLPYFLHSLRFLYLLKYFPYSSTLIDMCLYQDCG